ncbi:hypothetical protein SNEBB_004631, partial [Seison nebaliae]
IYFDNSNNDDDLDKLSNETLIYQLSFKETPGFILLYQNKYNISNKKVYGSFEIEIKNISYQVEIEENSDMNQLKPGHIIEFKKIHVNQKKQRSSTEKKKFLDLTIFIDYSVYLKKEEELLTTNRRRILESIRIDLMKIIYGVNRIFDYSYTSNNNSDIINNRIPNGYGINVIITNIIVITRFEGSLYSIYYNHGPMLSHMISANQPFVVEKSFYVSFWKRYLTNVRQIFNNRLDFDSNFLLLLTTSQIVSVNPINSLYDATDKNCPCNNCGIILPYESITTMYAKLSFHIVYSLALGDVMKSAMICHNDDYKLINHQTHLKNIKNIEEIKLSSCVTWNIYHYLEISNSNENCRTISNVPNELPITSLKKEQKLAMEKSRKKHGQFDLHHQCKKIFGPLSSYCAPKGSTIDSCSQLHCTSTDRRYNELVELRKLLSIGICGATDMLLLDGSPCRLTNEETSVPSFSPGYECQMGKCVRTMRNSTISFPKCPLNDSLISMTINQQKTSLTHLKALTCNQFLSYWFKIIATEAWNRLRIGFRNGTEIIDDFQQQNLFKKVEFDDHMYKLDLRDYKIINTDKNNIEAYDVPIIPFSISSLFIMLSACRFKTLFQEYHNQLLPILPYKELSWIYEIYSEGANLQENCCNSFCEPLNILMENCADDNGMECHIKQCFLKQNDGNLLFLSPLAYRCKKTCGICHITGICKSHSGLLCHNRGKCIIDNSSPYLYRCIRCSRKKRRTIEYYYFQQKFLKYRNVEFPFKFIHSNSPYGEFCEEKKLMKKAKKNFTEIISMKRKKNSTVFLEEMEYIDNYIVPYSVITKQIESNSHQLYIDMFCTGGHWEEACFSAEEKKQNRIWKTCCLLILQVFSIFLVVITCRYRKLKEKSMEHSYKALEQDDVYRTINELNSEDVMEVYEYNDDNKRSLLPQSNDSHKPSDESRVDEQYLIEGPELTKRLFGRNEIIKPSKTIKHDKSNEKGIRSKGSGINPK